MHKRLSTLAALLLLMIPALALAHGAGHVMGTIIAHDAEHLELKTSAGKAVSIKLRNDTQYFRGSEKATVADLAVGLRAIVHLATDRSAAEVHLPAPRKSGS